MLYPCTWVMCFLKSLNLGKTAVDWGQLTILHLYVVGVFEFVLLFLFFAFGGDALSDDDDEDEDDEDDDDFDALQSSQYHSPSGTSYKGTNKQDMWTSSLHKSHINDE